MSGGELGPDIRFPNWLSQVFNQSLGEILLDPSLYVIPNTQSPNQSWKLHLSNRPRGFLPHSYTYILKSQPLLIYNVAINALPIGVALPT